MDARADFSFKNKKNRGVMWRAFFFILWLGVTCSDLFSQPFLYGLTPGEGYNNGDLIEVDIKSNSIKSLYGFSGDLLSPVVEGGLMQADNGIIYGITGNGGKWGGGGVFSYNYANDSLTKIADFPQTILQPAGKLIQATNGLLYGISVGDVNAGISGVIFSVNPASGEFKINYEFISAFPGTSSVSGLTLGADGKFYGTTVAQFPVTYGTVFSFDPVNDQYHLIYNSADETRYHFRTGLTRGKDGRLYGVADKGIIYRLETNSITELYRFSDGEGSEPVGELLTGPDGKLYGSATGGSSGSGVIFSYDPHSNTYSKLADNSMKLGFFEQNKFRITGFKTGGTNNSGIIASFDILNKTFTDILDIGVTIGINPSSGLLNTTDGKIYWTTESGGALGRGTLYRYDPASASAEMLYDFNLIPGARPKESLVAGNDGLMYGTTESGGLNNSGVIFSFDLKNNLYRSLFDFSAATGSSPSGKLVKGKDGVMYGLTTTGGNSNRGVVYAFQPFTRQYRVLHHFNGNDGDGPEGSLLLAANGKLYGTTQKGGLKGKGVIFSIDTASSEYNMLFGFDGENGEYPVAGLIQASDGLLYGMCSGGTSNRGIIYTLNPATNQVIKIFDFTDNTGSQPAGNLFESRDHKLYGLGNRGGQYGFGVIFRWDIVSRTYEKIFDFRFFNGAYPAGSLMQASDGLLYGATSSGGSMNTGLVFSFNPADSVYKAVKEFAYNNFSGVYSGQFIELISCESFKITVSNSGPACEGTDIILSAEGGISFSWSGPEGYISHEQNPVLQNIQSPNQGNYVVTVQSEQGCTATDTTSVVVYPKPAIPVITASGPLRFCKDNEVELSIPAMDYNIWWYESDSVVQEDNALLLVVSNSGWYSVLLSDSNGCSVRSDSVQVIVDANPVKPVISRNGSTLSTLQGFARYEWFLNGNLVSASGAVFNPVQPGQYTVRVEDQNGCSSTSDPYEIRINNPPRIILGNASIYYYPNPVRDVLRIYNSGTTTEKIRLQISDMTGKILWEQDISGSLQNISTANLKPGLYNLLFSDGKERQSTKILVVHQ